MKKMNNVERIICLIIVIFIIVFVIMVINSNKKSEELIIDDKVKYEIIDNNIYGKMVMRGFYTESVSDGTDIIIGMGTKNTGGYSITLDKMEMEGNALIIYVNETSPKPTDIVTQAFTYPTLKVKVKKNVNSIKVVNQFGVEFKKLN